MTTTDEAYSEHDPDLYVPYEDDKNGPSTLPEDDEIGEEWVGEPYHIVDAEVMLPYNGESMKSARIIGRSKDKDGKPMGTFHEDKYLDSRIYDVLFPDGTTTQYAANILAENI